MSTSGASGRFDREPPVVPPDARHAASLIAPDTAGHRTGPTPIGGSPASRPAADAAADRPDPETHARTASRSYTDKQGATA